MKYRLAKQGIYNEQEGSYKFQWKDTIRWAIHFLIGAIIAHAILEINGFFGLGILICFLAYEFLEDWRVKDYSFKDIFGCLLMMIAGGYFIHYFWSV